MTPSSERISQDPDKPLELRTFLDGLKTSGRICDQAFCMALERSRKSGFGDRHMIEYLATLEMDDLGRVGNRLDSETLTRELARQAGQEYFRIDPLKIDVHRVTRVMDFNFSRRHRILCVGVGEDEVVIASADPYVDTWMSVLEHTSRKRIRRVVSNPMDIDRLTLEFYSFSRSIRGATRNSVRDRGVGNLEHLLELGVRKNADANDQHIVNVVDWLLQHAFEQRASDIHIEPGQQDCRIRFRIDGQLHSVFTLPEQVASAVTSRLKILGRMNLAEKRRPQDGRIKTRSPEACEVELRLSTLPTAYGEKLVLRVFNPDLLLKPFSELGLRGEDLRRWQAIISRNYGLVVITGPTGSGKTTTLYSTLRALTTEAVNVCTIEDPIEMTTDGFNQMQVQEQLDLNFAQGVRALLRQDPDIIMIGEVRDLETAQMAVQAALTGHLVLTTLHTNDAATAVTRLLEIGVPAYLIKATLVGVLAQRLLRTLCSHCRRPAGTSRESWSTLTAPWKAPMPAAVHEAVGCQECRETGYAGREAVYEVMPFTEALQRTVDASSDSTKIRRQAYAEGMHSLRMSAAQKVARGLTTFNEVLRVTPETGVD